MKPFHFPWKFTLFEKFKCIKHNGRSSYVLLVSIICYPRKVVVLTRSEFWWVNKAMSPKDRIYFIFAHDHWKSSTSSWQIFLGSLQFIQMLNAIIFFIWSNSYEYHKVINEVDEYKHRIIYKVYLVKLTNRQICIYVWNFSKLETLQLTIICSQGIRFQTVSCVLCRGHSSKLRRYYFKTKFLFHVTNIFFKSTIREY